MPGPHHAQDDHLLQCPRRSRGGAVISLISQRENTEAQHSRGRAGTLGGSRANPASPPTPGPRPHPHSHPRRVSEHMDLGPSELVGRSCYQFVHGQDAARIRQSHLDRENPNPCLPAPQTRVPQCPAPWKSCFRADHSASCCQLPGLGSTQRSSREALNLSPDCGGSGGLWGLRPALRSRAAMPAPGILSDCLPPCFCLLSSPPLTLPGPLAPCLPPALVLSTCLIPVSSCPVSHPRPHPSGPWAGPSAGQGTGDDWVLPLAAARWGLRVAAVRGHRGREREEPWGAPRALGQLRAQVRVAPPPHRGLEPAPKLPLCLLSSG